MLCDQPNEPTVREEGGRSGVRVGDEGLRTPGDRSEHPKPEWKGLLQAEREMKMDNRFQYVN